MQNTNAVQKINLRVIILSVLLTAVLAMANAYLALRLGLLTSASIPAAILSMGILRFFKNSTIFENNLVQTAASAGEAVAGGIVYTIPALIIIHYWYGFDYWTNVLIAFFGGVLGVFFSIPLRKFLVHDPLLKFPEGVAIAEVLKSTHQQFGFSEILKGGFVGALFEFFQLGLKVVASSWQKWFSIGPAIFGLGAGFSATMIGAGYLVGYEMAISIMLGAVIAWIGVLPIYTAFFSHLLPFTNQELPAIASGLWSNHIRYVGIGAMLFAGVFTFLRLLRPLCNSVYLSLTHIIAKKTLEIKPQDRDIPTSITAIVISAMAVALYFFLAKILPITIISSIMPWKLSLLLSLLSFVIIIGFLFSVITSYFSGMVGVTASPGSAIVIAGILFIAWVILHFVNYAVGVNWSPEIIRAAEAITIIIGSILTGIAAIANDNSQDLKVGQIIGAVPWQQQTMLLLGVLVSSLVIPPVMQVLFDVYGIADVTPRVGMDPAQTLPAPTSALMAALTQGVFQHTLPWSLLATGAIITLLFAWSRFSLLGIAIGMYLPLATSMPLLIGGAVAYIVRLKHLKKAEPLREMKIKRHRGVLVACGLVAGSALMDVILAIPFSAMHSADALAIMPGHLYAVSVILGGVSVMALSLWIMNITLKD